MKSGMYIGKYNCPSFSMLVYLLLIQSWSNRAREDPPRTLLEIMIVGYHALGQIVCRISMAHLRIKT
jgi:hypothetical protein